MAHGDAREGKWRGNWRMEWVASTLHTTSEHGVTSITTADGHTSAASSRLNWRPCRFKWTRRFRRKTKTGFCACAIAFQLACTTLRENLKNNMSVLTLVFCLCPPFHIVWHSTGSDLFCEEIWRPHSADEDSSLGGYDVLYLHQSTWRHTQEDWNLQIYFVIVKSKFCCCCFFFFFL